MALYKKNFFLLIKTGIVNKNKLIIISVEELLMAIRSFPPGTCGP
jgi:hypothetical protein